jgi:hypothetical protein
MKKAYTSQTTNFWDPWLLFDSLWTNTFGGTLEPQGDFGSKIYKGQKTYKFSLVNLVKQPNILPLFRQIKMAVK